MRTVWSARLPPILGRDPRMAARTAVPRPCLGEGGVGAWMQGGGKAGRWVRQALQRAARAGPPADTRPPHKKGTPAHQAHTRSRGLLNESREKGRRACRSSL